MHQLVKIFCDTNGVPRDIDRQYWHLVYHHGSGDQTLCEGEYFGGGESGCEFETKEVKRGGITCPNCLEIIKNMKAVKL